VRHAIAIILALLLPSLAVAEDTRLERLESLNQGRTWEAVGRLDLQGQGYCTGALIAPDLVLTAAHCLFDRFTGERFALDRIQFLAGWRNGRAEAYRDIRRAVLLPEYDFADSDLETRIRNDVALLELAQPIRNTRVTPFQPAERPLRGESVGVISYAQDRSSAPSLQEVCAVLERQGGILVLTCEVDHGASGSPVFSLARDGTPQIVSVVSAKAEHKGQRLALGASIDGPLQVLMQALANGKGFEIAPPPDANRITVTGERRDTGAKFIRP